MTREIFERIILGNTVMAYLRTGAFIVGNFFLVWVARIVILRRLQKWAERTKGLFDDFILAAVDKFIAPIICFWIVYGSLNVLHLTPSIQKGLSVLASIFMTFMGIQFLKRFFQVAIFDVYVKKGVNQEILAKQFKPFMPVLNAAIWGVGCIFLLDNLGFKISTIIAGLGIGGVAVALAASAILADLFAYFTIMFDRPFVIGDFIVIGDFLGNVEHIGIKSTRLRSLGGELVVISNKDLTDSRVRNYKVMERRRVVCQLGVTYDTPLDKLKEIPFFIKRIIEATPQAVFDRAHFFSFGDFKLVIEVVYYALSADYNLYMDIQQSINFAIKEEFEKRQINFAFPTQSVYLQTNLSSEKTALPTKK
jgi:small-conductance mechanosensitive channel